MTSNASIYAAVQTRILEALEAGTVPWQRPWHVAGAAVNIRSKRRYRGINVLLLALEGRSDPRWGTFKAIREAGGSVNRGEKGARVVLWKRVPRKPKEGEDEGSYTLLRSYVVFNGEQCNGLPALPVVDDRAFTPIETAEAIVKAYVHPAGSGPMIEVGGDRAAYSISRDVIMVPPGERFFTDESYYSTLFHELIHSTGAEKRLQRIEPALFGSDPYAKEELVAEIGSSFLCGVAGIGNEIDQSASYIAGWMRKIKDDPKLVTQAAAQAQRAADLVLGTTFEKDEEEEQARERELVAAGPIATSTMELWPSL